MKRNTPSSTRPYYGRVLLFKCQTSETRGSEFVRKTIEDLIVLLGAADIDGATQRFRGLIEGVGLEGTFSKCGITREDIPTIIQEGFSPARMANNPRMLRERDVYQILNNLV